VKRRAAKHTLSLPVQTRLDHRGKLVEGKAPLFPSTGTFEAMGGRETVARIVDGLYDRIETDSLLRPAFIGDLRGEREKVKRFFEAWFGGRASYFNADWPPGLKAAHGAISISRGMAGRWVQHFLAALAEAAKDPGIVKAIRPIISRLAISLVNRPDEPVPGERLRGTAYCADPRLLRPVQRDDSAGIAQVASAHPQVFRRYGTRLLLVAAVRGKAKAAEELLRQGADANAVAMLPGNDANTLGLPMLPITPLCGALAKRREAIVELLLKHGDQYDIFTAAFVGDLEAVRALLDRAPALANARDPGCDIGPITPLTHAVGAGQFEVARLILERGGTVGANSARLLRAAANAGDEALTGLLIEHGADPGEIGPGPWVLHPAIADRLLAKGAEVNYTPGAWIGLCCTGNSGHKENAALVQAMLRCGADVAVRYKGRTALHCAAKAGFAQVVEALIEGGAEVNTLDEDGRTPLDAVEEAGKSIDRKPVQRLLIARGGRRSRPEELRRPKHQRRRG
jgi:truncated hemoglobin YjbI/ankyrin repeat protein